MTASARSTRHAYGTETMMRAAGGDLMAQRYLVAAALAARTIDDVITDERLGEAETWARIAAAHGEDEDGLRLVYVLTLKETLILQGRSARPLAPIITEVVTLLAVLCEAEDMGIADVACETLASLAVGGSVTRDAVDEARVRLLRGNHATPYFEGLIPDWVYRDAVVSDGVRRTQCFETLAATLCTTHGVDHAAAAMLITSAPGYAPELLDSKDGWDAICAHVALTLGEPPAVTVCN